MYPIDVFGLLNIRKPPGPTSHDIVDGIRRRLPRGVKVGHAGTLDPFAEGVLVICVGPAARLASYVQERPKKYLAEVVLGAISTTDDPTGQISETPPAAAPDEQQVRSAIREFVGEIRQVPPAHSAVHVGGKRAYELARAGRQPDLAAKAVTVRAIEMLRYGYPRLDLMVTCGTGMYVRALARDIGRRLGTGAYCVKLVRTQVGPFRIEDAVSPDEADPERLLPSLLAVEHLDKVKLDPDACRELAMGRPVRLPAGIDAIRLQTAPGARQAGLPIELAVLDRQGELVAIAKLVQPGGTIRATKVLRR